MSGSADQEQSRAYARGMEHLVGVVQELSLARDLSTIVEIVRHAARALTGADGATFVLRDGDDCHYVDEDAIEPLWRGKRFPLSACISGWAMLHASSVAIEDIYTDDRIPADAYRPTFVRSLVMVPIRVAQPLGAIGNYWATNHRALPYEVKLLESLAHSTAVALENVGLFEDLQAALADAHAARDELQRQLDVRDDFISAAAHELRTPLTTLQLQLQALRQSVSSDRVSPERLQRYCHVSGRQLADLGRLGEDMLDASRIRLGRFELQRVADVDLAELVRAAADQVPLDPNTPVRLRIDATARGCWDRQRVLQMVRNLVDNAVKFGAGQPVEIVVDEADTTARVSVCDRGAGIEDGEQERIFERFGRSAPLTSFRGLGLGLFIARAIAEAHGGTLTVQSTPRAGSTFTASLPRLPAV